MHCSIKRFLCLILVLFLFGCALVPTTKHQPQKQLQVIELVPTGELNIKNSDLSLAGFGLVGLLLQSAIDSSESNKKKAEEANSKAAQDAAFMVMTDAIKATLPSTYGDNFAVQKRALPNTPFSEWFRGDRSDIAGKNSNSDDRLIIEYGFESLGINSAYGDRFAGGILGVRFIDPKTGAVIGRARTFRLLKDEIVVDPKINEGIPTKTAVADAFKKTITIMTQEAVLNITQK